MPYSRAWVVRSTAARMPPPNRSSTSVVAGLKYSEHGLSRGKRGGAGGSTQGPGRGGGGRGGGAPRAPPAGPGGGEAAAGGGPPPPPRRRRPHPRSGEPRQPARARGSAHGGRQV